jgi:hypothetical protein
MKNRWLLAFLGLLYLAFSFTGCASVKGYSKKFSPQVHANIGVFADTTITLVTDSELDLTQNQTIFIRDFFDPKREEEKALLAAKENVSKALRKVVRYSVDLVVITETNDSEAKMIAAYGDYIAGFNHETLKNMGYKKDHYDELVQKIRSQRTFLEALQMAQPIINAASQYINVRLDEYGTKLDALSLKLDSEIDQRYQDVILYQRALESEKYEILKALGIVYLAFKGDHTSYKQLVDSGVIRKKKLLPRSNPSDEDLMAIAEHLNSRLKATHLIGTEIKPDWDNYRNAHSELNELHRLGKNKISKARMIALAWLRAHQKMAAGVTSPAEWFNVDDLPSQLFKLGTAAIF